MFNFTYCLIGDMQNCVWWDGPLAIILVSVGLIWMRYNNDRRN